MFLIYTRKKIPSQFAIFLCTGARKLFPFLFSYSKGKKIIVNESMQTKTRDKKSEICFFMCHNSNQANQYNVKFYPCLVRHEEDHHIFYYLSFLIYSTIICIIFLIYYHQDERGGMLCSFLKKLAGSTFVFTCTNRSKLFLKYLVPQILACL